MAIDTNKITTRLLQAFEDVLKELAPLMKKNILKAFDNEHGYNEDGGKVSWPELSPEYVRRKPPRGRGGSSHPILRVEGDLRKGIDVIAKGLSIDANVFSNKMKARGKGTISVNEISKILRIERPHTNPSSKFMPGGVEVFRILEKHFSIAIDEMIQQGIWN